MNEPNASEVWKPISKEQEDFLSTPAFEAFFGGAAGPGKSDCLLMGALRQIDNPRYNAILFRRTFPELEAADGLIPRSLNWFRAYQGEYNSQKHYWTFPSGARIYFGHLEHEKDKYNYQGAQFQYIGFDELTQFTETMYLYLFSRCRTSSDTGLRLFMRSASNPGGIGHQWVKRRFITSGIVNRMAYFVRENDEDRRAEKHDPMALSRIFVPAGFSSNPKLDKQYISNLMAINEVERERLLRGNWDVANTGLVYGNWDSTLNISEHADYMPGYPVYWFVDDGYTNPRAILLCQQRPFLGKPDRLCVFAEYEQSGMLAAQSIADVKGWPYPEPDVVYYDAAAPEFAANAQAVGLFTAGGPKDVSRNMQIVRRLICDHNGERMIMVHPRCKKTIEAIPAFRYSETKKLPNGEPAPEHDDSSHINAALWYGCATIYYYIEVA